MNRIPNSLAHRSTRSQGNGQNASQLKHQKPGKAARPHAQPGRPARLEGRFAEEQRRITQGVANGTLTATEAQQLQTKLDTLHARFEKDAFETKGGKAKHSSCAQELQQLQRDTTSLAKNDDVDVQKLSSHLDKQLAAGVADGTLTADEATGLQQKADLLKVVQALASTPEEQKVVAQEFLALKKELGAERSDAEFDAAKRKANFEARIAAGLTDGSLTAREAAQLLQRASKLEDGNAAGFNRLNRDLFGARHDQQVNKATMSASLRSRVAALESAGKLTAEQAAAIRKSLDAVTAPHAHAAGARLNMLRERLAAYV